MFIDPHQPETIAQLAQRADDLPDECQLYLLLDGAFLPGLYRSKPFQSSTDVPFYLLFETLPGCTDAVRDVSPFLMLIKPAGGVLMGQLDAKLRTCSGWPMVSAIATTENLEQLGARLAAWCIIENDGQRFNFRFPDTRRLPGSFAALRADQRARFTGSMHFWSYIGRDGNWADLEVAGTVSAVAADAVLDDVQFGAILDDAAPDEVLFRLAYSGFESDLAHSLLHAAVSAALTTARQAGLEDDLREEWCEHVARHGHNSLASLAQWRTNLANS
ncbi:DUF4123 domain-containing protein [Massilia sp. TWP1-3-3]|uniref:DUF4123 domain-containing protein n=1 Tax=Massilia sp. TWP1-3-3 TaxID=2804573 RepID=UPI003CE6E11F